MCVEAIREEYRRMEFFFFSIRSRLDRNRSGSGLTGFWYRVEITATKCRIIICDRLTRMPERTL